MRTHRLSWEKTHNQRKTKRWTAWADVAEETGLTLTGCPLPLEPERQQQTKCCSAETCYTEIYSKEATGQWWWWRKARSG